MNQTRHLLFLLTMVLVVAALTSFGYQAFAQGSAGFEIPWYTFDGGGGQSQGARFTVSGTIGQPDAGYASDGAYAAHGGFWSWLGSLVLEELHLPMILKD